MSKNKYDFAGWATKYGIGCSDGRTISKGAFAHCDEIVVPSSPVTSLGGV